MPSLSSHRSRARKTYPSGRNERNQGFSARVVLCPSERAHLARPGRKPEREFLRVPLPPSGIHPDLLDRVLPPPRAPRGLAGREAPLHILRRVRRREFLGDVNEPPDEDPGLRIPPVELVPVVLDERPGHVEPDSGTDPRDVRDHDDRILGSDRIRERAPERLLQQALVPRLREGDEETHLLLLKGRLTLEFPQGLTGGLVRLLGNERVDEPAKIRVERRWVFQIPSEAPRRFLKRSAVLMVAERIQHGRPLESVEVALALFRLPSAPFSGGTEEVAHIRIEASQIWLRGNQRLQVV